MVKRKRSGGTEKRIIEYPNQLAMALRRHSETAGAIDNMLEEEAEEVRERILAKLARKREQDERRAERSCASED